MFVLIFYRIGCFMTYFPYPLNFYKCMSIIWSFAYLDSGSLERSILLQHSFPNKDKLLESTSLFQLS